MTVPFPAPDGPEITKTQGMCSASEKGEELGPLALGQAADRLAGLMRHCSMIWRLKRARTSRVHEHVYDLCGDHRSLEIAINCGF